MNDSGYIEFSLNGEGIGLRFGIHAVRLFLDKMGGDEQLISSNTVNELGIATLIYCGYINECIVKDIPQAYKLGYFVQAVEDSVIHPEGRKVLEDIANAYMNSKYTKRVIESAKDASDELKKKKSRKV